MIGEAVEGGYFASFPLSIDEGAGEDGQQNEGVEDNKSYLATFNTFDWLLGYYGRKIEQFQVKYF